MSLLPNASQDWCEFSESWRLHRSFLQLSCRHSGLSDGLHLVNVTVTPSEVWCHDAHIGDTDSITCFIVHGGNIFCCRLRFPENVTYVNTDVFLKPVLNSPFSWMSYSLDDTANFTIGERQIPTVNSGRHFVIVYATDMDSATTRSKIVFFSVE